MKLLSHILDLIFPPRCVFCHELLSVRHEGLVCESCEKTLPRFRGEQKCEFVDRVISPFRYQDAVKDSIHRFKFGGRSFYASAYAPYMAEALRESGVEFDTLSWVPLHKKRLRQRGYDQAQELALALGKALGKDAESVLVKKRNAAPQSQTGDAAARRANISGCYVLAEGAAVAGKHILLLDDVFTTGATLSECARVLMLAGAESVVALTVATAHQG